MVRVLAFAAAAVAVLVVPMPAGSEAGCRTPASAADGALRFAGGAGDVVTEPFRLERGTALVTIRLTGEEIESVDLLPAPGSPGSTFLMVAVAGEPYAGTQAARVSTAGDFVLAVGASAPWSVTIEPSPAHPSPSSSQSNDRSAD